MGAQVETTGVTGGTGWGQSGAPWGVRQNNVGVAVEKYGCSHTCPPISRNNQAIIGESIPCSSATKLWWKSMGITVEGLGTSKLFERKTFVSCTYQWHQPAACYVRPGPIVPSQFSIETSY
jgi:hypothetical protein